MGRRTTWLYYPGARNERNLSTFVATGDGAFKPFVTTVDNYGAFIPNLNGRDLGRFADVTGDGKADYIVAWLSGGDDKRHLATFVGKVDGTFAQFVDTGGMGTYLPDPLGRDMGEFADVDGDKRADYVVVTSSNGQRQIAVYLAKQDGIWEVRLNTRCERARWDVPTRCQRPRHGNLCGCNWRWPSGLCGGLERPWSAEVLDLHGGCTRMAIITRQIPDPRPRDDMRCGRIH